MPDDVAGLLVGLLAGAALHLADHGGRVVLHVVLDALEQDLLRLLGGHAGELLEAGLLLGDRVLEVLLALRDLAQLARELVLALVDRLGAALDGLLALHEPVLEHGQLLAALLHLGLGLGLQTEDLVLGLDEGFLLQCLGLLLGVCDDAARGLAGTARVWTPRASCGGRSREGRRRRSATMATMMVAAVICVPPFGRCLLKMRPRRMLHMCAEGVRLRASAARGAGPRHEAPIGDGALRKRRAGRLSVRQKRCSHVCGNGGPCIHH